MSCWVVPTIAAEIWGISVDQILQRVRDGNLAHRLDEGFMFVDVAPNGGGCGTITRKEEHPPTFTVLSEVEVEALIDEATAPVASNDEEDATEDAGESQSPDDDEASVDLGDWRAARQRVGRTRIPPGARPRAA
jgi:hypothetical protein